MRYLRIALLNCERFYEHLPRDVCSKTGGYFENLQETFNHVCRAGGGIRENDNFLHGIQVKLTDFDVKGGLLPENPRDFDGVLISGSLSGVYDNDPWVKDLLRYIRTLEELEVRTCGISFGHQAIAQALGGKVKKNPKGSEISVREVELTSEAKEYFRTSRNAFSLQYHHNDTITELPPGFSVIGGNNVTKYQGMFKNDKFLSFCGHPDYSHKPEVLKVLLDLDRRNLWVHEQLIEMGLETLYRKTDYEWVTRQIISFYLGKLGIVST